MLTVYRSNRAELLAQLLATQLRLAPPDPFERVQVVVNTWPTGRWLGECLAIHLGGVSANLRFPFPGGQLRHLVDLVLGDPPAEAGGILPVAGDDDPWRASRLVWPLLEALPVIAAGEDGGPLRHWLAGRDLTRRLDRDSWQLGRAVADAFDDYALYRPDLLEAWQRGEAVDGQGRPLPESQRWQPRLFALLRQRLEREPFGLRVRRTIARLRSGGLPEELPAGPLRLFGVSSLAPVQVELLQALSGVMPVDLFLLTPCRDLWQRCQQRRQRLSDALALALPLDGDWLTEATGLEARFGRLGGEFQQLLEGTGEAQLGTWREGDLFLAAAGIASGEAPPPLLAQLQEQLVDPERRPRLQRAADDQSLEFHPCPGRLREVQIVRDRLLQLMAADPALEPRHILVMTPQVDRIAPLVASVFGDSEATGVPIPWRLTDRSQQSQAGIGRTLLELLRLAGERLTASALERLLECPPLQRRFDLDAEQTSALTTVLQDSGFRWGLDGAEREGCATHGLSWTIDRLLLGLVLPAEPGLAPADTAPWDGGHPLERVGRWVHLLGRLRHWIGELRRSTTVPLWGTRLRALLADLFRQEDDAAAELGSIHAAIDDWLRSAAGCGLELEASVVASVLDERLSADSGRFGHRSGALTISALEPMRAIPHRVIVLMGLDADGFPRQRQRPGFHLMEHERRLGDPGPADQDRYALLEAVLSARDHLLITWSCRNERTGEALQPASPVRQWLQWLRTQLGEEAVADLTASHPADPLDPAAFLPRSHRPPESCDRRLLATRRLLDTGASPAAPGLIATAVPKNPPATAAPPDPFDDLRGWLLHPQRSWLRQLGVRAREWVEPVEDLDPLELEEWQRAQLLRQQLDSPATDDADSRQPGSASDWLERTRGDGRLPDGAAGLLEAQLLGERWSQLHDALTALGPGRRDTLRWRSWQAAPLRHGDAVVAIRIGRAQAPHHMDLWLDLLFTAVAAPDPPRRGVLIARGKPGFESVLQLNCPAPEAAAAELERLAALRETWRLPCWPVPPRTGLAFLTEERRRPGKGHDSAAKEWEGNFDHPGEREQEEMTICFGARRPAAELIGADFPQRAAELYGPLLEAGS